jgi:acetylglutamate kinase
VWIDGTAAALAISLSDDEFAVITGVPHAMAPQPGSPSLVERRKHEELAEVVDDWQIIGRARSR